MEMRLEGPAGGLAALYEEPEEEPGLPTRPLRGAAVVCHPHPLHGGTMRNTIVFRTARALRAAGLATLRFDFRGVETSEGQHDGRPGPEGEEGDASAALDFLQERHPGLPLWAAGYSFGARTICGLATRDERIERVVLVALPVAVYECACIDRIALPGLIVLGGSDTFGTRADLDRRHPRLSPRLAIEEIPGADHFFRGRTPVLEERVRTFALSSLESPR